MATPKKLNDSKQVGASESVPVEAYSDNQSARSSPRYPVEIRETQQSLANASLIDDWIDA